MTMNYHIIDHRHFNDSRKHLLEQFGNDIYLSAFPNSDEREPFENILARIESHRPDEPETIAVLAGDDIIFGGIICDWYPACDALEIIYLAVNPSCRRWGIGRSLLFEGTKMILNTINNGNRKINVFLEVENPMAVMQDSPDTINPVGRISFFNKCGARRVPINYVQPPLYETAGWASNMFLLMMPDLSYCKDSISINELTTFLREFYKGLHAEYSPQFKELIQNVTDVADSKGNIWLDRLTENPQFKMEHCSVAVHFKLTDHLVHSLPDIRCYCPVFESYECDLMNYSHQKHDRRPFTTHHWKLIEDAELLMPEFYSYVSEGHSFYKLSERTSIRTDISINWSGSVSSGDILVHMILSPSEDNYMNELDLIKIITHFGSLQESTSFLGNFMIRTGRKQYSSFENFLSGEFIEGGYELCRTGISEIELSALHNNGGVPLFRNFEDFENNIIGEEGPRSTGWNKVLCGIILGIFDFERMNVSEIYDTIRPIVQRSSSFDVLCRGHLCKLCHKSEYEYERVENILISPYLLIPSTALAFNELTVIKNRDILKNGVRHRKVRKILSWTISEQIRQCSALLYDVRSSLSLEYFEDIFHYPSEIEILKAGKSQRGIDSSYMRLLKAIEIKTVELDELKSKYDASIDTIQNTLLMVLAIMQVYTAINSYDKAFFACVILTIIIGLLILIRKRRL